MDEREKLIKKFQVIGLCIKEENFRQRVLSKARPATRF